MFCYGLQTCTSEQNKDALIQKYGNTTQRKIQNATQKIPPKKKKTHLLQNNVDNTAIAVPTKDGQLTWPWSLSLCGEPDLHGNIEVDKSYIAYIEYRFSVHWSPD